MEDMNQINAFENMWKTEDNITTLIGSKCSDCNEIYFPIKEVTLCSNCQGNNLKEIELSREGSIYSYTVVNQRPAGGYYKGPIPFIYGIVELPEGILIQSHIIYENLNSINIGDKVTVILDTLYSENAYEKVVYKFKHFEEMEMGE